MESKTKEAELKRQAIAKLIETNKTKLLKQCDTLANNLSLDGDFSKNLSNLTVCMLDNGKIQTGNCSNGTELLCVDEVGLNANTVTEGRTSSISWVLHKTLPVGSSSGSLSAGFYKVEVAGGKGSNGSSYSPNGGAVVVAIFTLGTSCASGNCGKHSGGFGGNGDVQERIFSLDSSKTYKYTAGRPSKFSIDGIIDITAQGGKDGGNASHNSNGLNGASAGNGKNGGPAYVKIYKPK